MRGTRLSGLFLGAIALLTLDLYAYQALRTVFGATSLIIPVTVLFWMLTATSLGFLFAAGTTRRDLWSQPVRVYGPPLLMSSIVGKLLIVAFLLIDDLVILGRHGIQLLSSTDGGTQIGRLPFFSLIGLIFGSIPMALLSYGMLRNAYKYRVRRIDLAFPDMPEGLEGLRIVQISDIHSGSLTRPHKVEEAVEMINALEPDLIFFTGDLVNFAAGEIEPFIPIFRKLRSRLGIYSCTGNHDYGDYVAWPDESAKRENFELFVDQHRKLGWRLLMNEHEMVDIDGARLAIIGVENWSASLRFPKHGELATASAGTEDADLRLLLSHDPSHWKAEVLDHEPGIDAMFAGHTHGFQFGFEWGNFQWSPGQYVYSEWAGLYRFAHQYLYVNRGFGYTFYPGRVGILPEITLFTLREDRQED